MYVLNANIKIIVVNSKKRFGEKAFFRNFRENDVFAKKTFEKILSKKKIFFAKKFHEKKIVEKTFEKNFESIFSKNNQF